MTTKLNDDILASTGNTAKEQEMFFAGVEAGEANAKNNADVRAAPAAPESTVKDADAQKEAVMDAIADALGHAYDCTRVWAAWGVGTMSQDDFHLIADDAGRLGEIADAAIAAMRPAPAAGDAHPDDIAVDRFAVAMKAKLAKKRAEGRSGWDDKEKCGASHLSEMLRRHVAKGGPVDVGNLAMMLHQRGEAIMPASGDALELKRKTDLIAELSKIIHNMTVAQQAAWIEWQHGAGAEAGMQWIENGLAGPGQIPDKDEPYATEAQAYFDANQADPFPTCHCGRPSNILHMGNGYCSNEHYRAALAVQRKGDA